MDGDFRDEQTSDALRVPARTERVARLGHWVWHFASSRLEWSQGMLEIYGFDREPSDEPLALRADRALHPDDRERVYERHLALLQGGQGSPLVYRIVRADGSIRVLSSEPAEVTSGADGKPVSFSGIVQDVTELRRIEEDLRESEARHRRLVEAIPGILYTFDEARGGAYYSPQVEAILGWTPQHLREHPMLWHDSIHPDDRPAVDRAVQSDAASLEIEYRIRDAAGAWRWLLDRSVRISSGQAGKSIEGLALDITERHRAEEERERLEAELRQAHKMESVGRLAGGVAHDFNNMLGVILGNVELALEQVDPKGQLFEDLVEIRSAAERSAELTRQLLAFARKQAVAPRQLDLNEATVGTLKMLRRLVGANVQLTWLPGSDLWPVKIDPSQVVQVLTNLCVNARDALAPRDSVAPEERGSAITIETGNATLDAEFCAQNPGSSPGEYVRLAVSDDGRGMDPDTLSHLFEPFFTTKGVGEGTGLGLATVYGIVKQNGGFIHVKTALGEGSTFSVYLPRIDAASSRGA